MTPSRHRLDFDPKYLDGYAWRSALLVDTGDYDGAVANYTDAIKLFPDEDNNQL